MKRTCVKCKGRMTIPAAEDIKKVADELDTATSPHPPTEPSLYSAAGGALAYLRMYEALANGLCIFCMPPAKWVQDSIAAGAAK